MSASRTMAKHKGKRTGDNSREKTVFKEEDINRILCSVMNTI